MRILVLILAVLSSGCYSAEVVMTGEHPVLVNGMFRAVSTEYLSDGTVRWVGFSSQWERVEPVKYE